METAGFLLTTATATPVEGGQVAGASVAVAQPATPQQNPATPVNTGAEQDFAKVLSNQAQSLNNTLANPVRRAPILITFNQQPLNTVALTATTGKGLQLGGQLLPGIAPEAMAGWVADKAGLADLAEALPEGVSLEDFLAATDAAQGLPAELEQQVAWQSPAGINVVSSHAAASAQAQAAPLVPQQTINSSAQQLVSAGQVDNAQIPGQSIPEQMKPISTVMVAADQMPEQRVSQSGSQLAATAATMPAQLATSQAVNVQPTNTAASNVSAVSNLQGLARLATAKDGIAINNPAAIEQTADVASSLSPATSVFPRVEAAGSYQQMAAPQFQTSIATQVTAQGWGDTVMQRVMWMSSQQVRSAEIQLDPPELGSLMVKIQTSNDQTTVNFTSPHALVRDTLDQNLPRLRELMAEQE